MNYYQHGFDLTSFSSPEAWEEILKEENISINSHHEIKEGYFLWVGKNVSIYTQYNPITGQHSYRNIDPKFGFAGYIGIEGDKETVLNIANKIKKIADYVKDESVGKRDFI